MVTTVPVFDHWDWDKHWIVIALAFDFDDLLRCFVDDDLWFLLCLFFTGGDGGKMAAATCLTTASAPSAERVSVESQPLAVQQRAPRRRLPVSVGH